MCVTGVTGRMVGRISKLKQVFPSTTYHHPVYFSSTYYIFCLMLSPFLCVCLCYILMLYRCSLIFNAFPSVLVCYPDLVFLSMDLRVLSSGILLLPLFDVRGNACIIVIISQKAGVVFMLSYRRTKVTLYKVLYPFKKFVCNKCKRLEGW